MLLVPRNLVWENIKVSLETNWAAIVFGEMTSWLRKNFKTLESLPCYIRTILLLKGSINFCNGDNSGFNSLTSIAI